MIQELDTVVLTRDVPAERLRKGDLGAGVFVSQAGAVCEVEFMTSTDRRGASSRSQPMPCGPPLDASFRTRAKVA